MKTNETANNVEAAGLGETTSFSIRASGKAFKTLISGIYSDKVAAVIREVCTNAHDAHVAAGKKDVPFDVYLPTLNEPHFVVRDFGPSMTHEQLTRLMGTLFESSKENTNTLVGAFGLGSKSPFAMTDTYSITAWKDGKRRIYQAYIGEDSVPRLSLMGTLESDEPEGIEVSVPVDAKDFRAFADKARGILRWFPTRPVVHRGGDSFFGSDEDNGLIPLASGDGWAIYDSYTFSRRSVVHGHVGMFARQGCVIYPITPSSVMGASFEDTSMMEIMSVVDFPIGALEVATSRESLAYDARTSKAILLKVRAIRREIEAKIESDLQKAETLWEASRLIHGNALLSYLPSFITNSLRKSKFKDGREILHNVRTSALVETVSADGVVVQTVADYHHYDSYKTRNSSMYLNSSSRRSFRSHNIYLGDDSQFFVFAKEGENTNAALQKKLMQFVTAKRASAHKTFSVFLFVVSDDSKIEEILTAIGKPPSALVERTSNIILPNMPKPTKSTKANRTKPKEVPVREVRFEYSEKDGTFTYKVETNEKVIPLEDSAYVIWTAHGIVTTEVIDPFNVTGEITSLLETLGCLHLENIVQTDRPIYVVRTIYKKRISKNTDWKDVFEAVYANQDAIERRLHEYRAKQETVEAFRGDHVYATLAKAYGKNVFANAVVTSLASNNPLNEYQTKLVETLPVDTPSSVGLANAEKAHRFRRSCINVGIYISDTEYTKTEMAKEAVRNNSRVSDLNTHICKKYPLLPAVAAHYKIRAHYGGATQIIGNLDSFFPTMNQVIDYILSIDASEAARLADVSSVTPPLAA